MMLRSWRLWKPSKRKEKNYVLHQLHQFDKQTQVVEERAKWGWLPMYSLLKRHPLQVGFQCPWEHTPQELQNILAELENEYHPFSLQKECMHIIKGIQDFLLKYIWEATLVGSSQQGIEPSHDLPLLSRVRAHCTANHCHPICVRLWTYLVSYN